MNRSEAVSARGRLFVSLAFLALLAVLAFSAYLPRTSAGGVKRAASFQRTESLEHGIPKMYDIREDKGAWELLSTFRQDSGLSASSIADARDAFVRGEAALKERLPHSKVEYNSDIRIPEVITPDTWRDTVEFLSGPSDEKRSEILRSFIKQNSELIGIDDGQADSLVVAADYTNPDGNLSYAHLEQKINEVPVFRGEIKAGFTKDGRIIRVINNLAPGVDYNSASDNFGDPLDAVRRAAEVINYEPTKSDVTVNPDESNGLKTVFGEGDWATTAEKIYFPTEPGVVRPAWRVLIWKPVNAYYVIVDSETGTTLWLKNITDDQTQSASYQVYTNPNAFINAADSPAPLTPGPTDPTTGTQGMILARNLVTLIGNEAPNTFNNNGWITDGANITDGNNLEAGIDRDGTNGVDAPMQGDTACPGMGCRVFTSTWNPPPGNPAPGDDPLTAQAQRGAVIQMFYVMNLYHDVLYRFGFTEAARNFQQTNFSGMGVGNDRVSAEGQDSSGTNNANFSTPADGGRGRMQMFLWTGPTPDYDGTTDADVIIHEVTHGTSNRLHGNGSGLGGMGGMMGEGWSDWYAHTLLAEPTDPINGIYTTGGYATFQLGGFNANYYYGIRRFPKAVIGFTGGPARAACGDAPCPYNPLTFRHINSDCDTSLGTPATAVSSAFPRSPVIATSGNCSQVHNAGEIWSSALWEVRALMVTRLGFAAGTSQVLQVVTDGMKLAPLNPTFLQERDAIIAAAAALAAVPENAAAVQDVREGFRRRGMGFSASVQSSSSVTEAFDFPNVRATDPFSVSDSTGDNDGFPEPGENVLLSVAVTNPNTGATINNVLVNVNGGSNVSYGSIADGQTVSMNIPYTVPANTACGSMHSVQINVTSSVGAQTPVSKSFRVGVPVGGPPVTFANNAAIDLPNGQPTTTSGPASVYPSTITASGLSGIKKIKLTLDGISHTFPGDLDFLLEGPGGQKFIFLSDSGGAGDATSLNMSFRDGAAAQPSTTQWAAGEFKPYNSGANDAFAAPAPAGPYTNAAPAGSDTFESVFGTNGSAMNGTWKLWIVDDAGADAGTIANGWSLTFESDDYLCGSSAPMDFDGDGKTDVSIFRPNPTTLLENPAPEGSSSQWWIYRSGSSSALGMAFGQPTDKLTPADFTGDGKTDVAFFRPSTNTWYVLRSEDMSFFAFPFGASGDIPAPGDFDGDGKADPAVFRPSTGTWFILRSSDQVVQAVPFGTNGDKPTVADFDGDGKDDVAIYRPSVNQWWQLRSTAGAIGYQFGAAGDRTAVGDYTGDGKADVAFFRPSTNEWYVIRSEDSSFYAFPWGAMGDLPAPGDFDGDGKADAAVFRPSNATWYIFGSTSGSSAVQFGLNGDAPIPGAYVQN